MDKDTNNNPSRLKVPKLRGTKTKRGYQRADSFRQCLPLAACQGASTKSKAGFPKGHCDHKTTCPMCTTQVSTEFQELNGTTLQSRGDQEGKGTKTCADPGIMVLKNFAHLT